MEKYFPLIQLHWAERFPVFFNKKRSDLLVSMFPFNGTFLEDTHWHALCCGESTPTPEDQQYVLGILRHNDFHEEAEKCSRELWE